MLVIANYDQLNPSVNSVEEISALLETKQSGLIDRIYYWQEAS